MNPLISPTTPTIGVGLRHAHFEDALTGSTAVDFVEVHSENFFARGGALHQILQDIAEQYPVSLHSTAMGLGSAAGIPKAYLEQLSTLTQLIDPLLMSDHACFAWGQAGEHFVHAGDLLPIVYNDEGLAIMTAHVDQIQQHLGRQLLVENLSAYLALPGSTMSEKEFLLTLSDKTECGLLVDLNNILVNEYNADNTAEDAAAIESAKLWLSDIPAEKVGEIHLAGFTQPGNGGIAVDDHSQPVSDTCWSLYEHALTQFGAIPTLIEWDNELPEWHILVAQAEHARMVAEKALAARALNHA